MGEPFENSEAWKSARVLTNEAYSFCRREPLSKDYALRDQLQRAALSVMNNIARRSCGEVRSMTYVLLDNKFISATEQAKLLARCISTGKLITGLIRSLDDRQ